MKRAFTLAEVLITLAVIGIVAALTIGIFLPKIHATIRSHQIAVAETKFTKAMEQMALNNAIGPYYENTKDFVDELQNYLKIAKVCENDKLEECFGYEKITLNNGEEFEIKEIKSGANLGMEDNYGETIGIVTIDGTGMILSWNKECPILEPKVYPWGNNTNETTSCVAAIMDINLDKSPNTQNKDVALFRAEKIAESCGMSFTVGTTKYCWGAPFVPTRLTRVDCETNKDDYGIISCYEKVSYAGGTNDDDLWGGAMKQCYEKDKRLPNRAELATFAKYVYGTENISEGETTTELIMNTITLGNISPALLASYNSRNESFALWSNQQESSGAARNWIYKSTFTYYIGGGLRNASDRYAVCVPK